MTSLSKEIDVWAWTADYDLIVVEGSDLEPLYGLQNRHTLVIEITEAVFSNALVFLIDIQRAYEDASKLIGEDGSVSIDEFMKIKKELH